MLITASSLLLLGLSSLVSARCGTLEPSDIIRALHLEYLTSEADLDLANMMGASASPFEQAIDTYVHIIQGDNSENNTQRAFDQIDVLNREYSNTGFSFNLASVETVVHPSWLMVEPQSDQEYEMKSSLRQGTYRDLNIYIVTIAPLDNSGSQILGYATFPEPSPSETTFNRDGVVLQPFALPGGQAPYDLGMTGVHEVGHWLSLFHTFQSDIFGCFGSGDYVRDTPAEASPAFGCQEGRDTCLQPGLDPIHNFMDYSDDACLTEFTNGQIMRMQSMYRDLRAASTAGN